jgi:hypothetical protein
MLPDQQYHSTLIQAFDPVRLFSNRTEEARRIMEARTEVLLNLLFGREVVLPAGQIADSPAVAVVYREVMLAFDQLPPAKRERIRAKPFRIALEHGYEDYTDYVARYIDVGAPIIQLHHGWRICAFAGAQRSSSSNEFCKRGDRHRRRSRLGSRVKDFHAETRAGDRRFKSKEDQAAEHIIAVTKLSSWDTPSLRVGQTA